MLRPSLERAPTNPGILTAAEEKAPFEDLASKAKEEYKVALANYKGGAAEDDDNAPKKAKIESDDDAEEAEDADEEVGADDDDAEDVE